MMLVYDKYRVQGNNINLTVYFSYAENRKQSTMYFKIPIELRIKYYV